MNNQIVSRDERTTVVENAGYRIAYLIMSFGLLLCIAYRGFVVQQSSWDLLVLVVLGGVVASTYQGINRALYGRRLIAIAASIVLAGVLAIGFVMLFR